MEQGLRIITSGAQAAAIEALALRYGGALDLSFGSSLGAAADAIPARLARGDSFDLLFLAESGHRALAGQGLLGGDFVPLVESRIGAAVRAGAPVPDISTPEALRDALLSAGVVACAASASGIYLKTHVFPALGIEAQMQAAARTILSERVGRVVARGEADLGFQQMSELMPIPGITILGGLPAPFDIRFVFGVAFGPDPARRPAAEAFIRFLQGPEGRAALAASGLDPVAG